MKTRLGLDLGTNSIGWSLVEIDSDNAKTVKSVIATGVRIFQDGREPSATGSVGDSKAVHRRNARGIRRNRDRKIQRTKNVLNLLREYNLLPKDYNETSAVFKQSPYEARSKAVSDSTITAYELGRAIYNISLRRGFKSNRLEANKDKDEATKTKEKMKALETELGIEKTLGQYLYEIELENQSLKSYKTKIRFDGSKSILSTRKLYEIEFNKIKEKQHNKLTAEGWEKLYNQIFFQRLKRQEKGKCSFFTEEYRAYNSLPIAHQSRIIQYLNHLRYLDDNNQPQKLSNETRLSVYNKLQTQKSMSLSAIKKLANISDKFFTIEKEDEKPVLKGNETAVNMVETIGENNWNNLTPAHQNELVFNVLDSENGDEIKDFVKKYLPNLTEEQIDKLFALKLSNTVGKVSQKFLELLTPHLLADNITYAEAVTKIPNPNKPGEFLHHSMLNNIEIEVLEELPYYGKILTGSTIGQKTLFKNIEEEYGKIGNPTVHVALNQLRRIVNSIIAQYSTPDEIHLEVGKDLKNARADRDKISKANNANKKKNDFIKSELKKLNINNPTRDDIIKWKLFEECSTCVYCGNGIGGASSLFSSHSSIQVDHILPWSKTFDDGYSNKVLACNNCNLSKKGRSPDEAFPDRIDDIISRSKILPKNKQWRFAKGAMFTWENNILGKLSEAELKEKELSGNAFLAKQLIDNQYIARISQRYLSSLGKPVVSIPGQLTAILREKLRFNNLIGEKNIKDRGDHRHHAIDATVVALTTRSLLQKVSTDSAKIEKESDNTKRLLIKKFIDYDNYMEIKNSLIKCLNDTVISYKPDHGLNGSMFNETAYGIVKSNSHSKKPEFEPNLYTMNKVVRKSIDTIKYKEIGQIRDKKIRERLLEYLGELKDEKKKEFKDKILAFTKETGIRNVRILLKVETYPVIHGNNKQHIKEYARGEFAFCDIWKIPVLDKKTNEVRKYEAKGHYIAFDKAVKIENAKNAYKQSKASNDIIKIQDSENRLQKLNATIDKDARKELGYKIGDKDIFIHPTSKKLMRLFKNDLVMLKISPIDEKSKMQIEKLKDQLAPEVIKSYRDENGEFKDNKYIDTSNEAQGLRIIDGVYCWILAVKVFSTTNNCLFLVPHLSANYKPVSFSINVLVNDYSMQKVGVSPSGVMRYK